MNNILKQLEQKVSWKESMRKSCRLGKLDVAIVSYFTPLRIRAAFQKFQNIYSKKSNEATTEKWIENELKAFYWICVAVSCLSNITVAEFGQGQWATLEEIFYFKQPLTLEYEAHKLMEAITLKQAWNSQQENILAGIVKQNEIDANKWSEFARRLFQASGKRYFRTGKQCRERWLNHLDSSKNHGQWTAESDIEVAQLFVSEGKKWSQVAKKLNHKRTEHMVKNRYKTILAKQRKLYPKINSQSTLIKSFLDPSIVHKHYTKLQAFDVKQEIKAEQLPQQQVPEVQQQSNEEDAEERLEEPENIERLDKNVPQTSCTFQMAQTYSPWYVNIPITPTFSPSVPFFINFSSFTAFQASLTNKFYLPAQEQRQDQLSSNK